MSYETPLSAAVAVENVYRRRYLLPAIQREFVWKHEQVEQLFDSLLQGYPIGSFLFWRVDADHIEDYRFYEFVREYHERDARHNPPADVSGEKEITVVLDGQQRLTSLYLGLKGSYAYKIPYKRWDNDMAFPKRRLHLDLGAPGAADLNLRYDFRFLTEREATRDSERHWFLVGNLLDFDLRDVNRYLSDNDLGSEFAVEALSALYEAIRVSGVVPYFLERSQDIDKVLDIFIRANTGGTKLSYSDLLLSIATANWQQQDAREEVYRLVDQLNAVGEGFNFDKDFVLKSCLVLTDSDVAFKVKNFTKANISKIETMWPNISESIRLAVDLASALGFSRQTLPTANALIPVAYYAMVASLPQNYVQSDRDRDDRATVRKWLVLAILKKTFSGLSDNVLRWTREVISSATDGFPIEGIEKRLAGTTKSLRFGEEELRALLDYQYGASYTFSVLSLLYPTLDYSNRFHVDHLHPRGLFTKRELRRRNVPEDKWEFYLENPDRLGNLQILEGVRNLEKSSKEFQGWVQETYPDGRHRREYFEKHYIPDVDLSFDGFDEFMAEREGLILRQIGMSLS